MVSVPLGVFYFLFHVVFRSDPQMLGWSGIGSVIAVNCVVVSYVVMAWNEKDDGAPGRSSERRVN
jgi:hypothetical protein